MRKKKPAWPADTDLAQRFPPPANASVVTFLTNGERWSAHSDPAEEFCLGAEDLIGVKVYTPDRKRFAYEMAYTQQGVIFGLVLGMGLICLRLPQSDDKIGVSPTQAQRAALQRE